MPQISIITVNYKTPALVIQLIKSIYETTHGISFEIIVVDNASEDNGKQLITKQFPSVVWIQNDENEGFARGNNKGMQAAKGQYILLINSDVLVKDNTIASCHDFYQKQVNPVILGCKLLNKDLTHQNSVYYSISGFKELLSYNLIISRLLKKQPKNLNDQQEIKALMGAFLFFEKNILKKTGLFDDDFFLYSEEIEWQIRA
ncbi:MAG: glycosyltransferase family 2 protein, partial [Marinilabiliales bacterium]